MKPETQRELSESGYDVKPIGAEKREQLAQSLTKEEYDILLNQGTEAPFCGSLLDNKKAGIYACRLCGLPLFDSKSKFTSDTGWASFYELFDDEHIKEIRDAKFGMVRTEIRCARCDGHQGHVFPTVCRRPDSVTA